MSNVIQFPVKNNNISKADELLIKLVEISEERDRNKRYEQLSFLFLEVTSYVYSIKV